MPVYAVQEKNACKKLNMVLANKTTQYEGIGGVKLVVTGLDSGGSCGNLSREPVAAGARGGR